MRRALVGANPRRTLARVVTLVVAAYVVFGFLLIPVRGQGPSMWPTLQDGQLVLVNRLAYWTKDPQRGDVVALSVAGGRVVYIKRIVGLPGERVRIDAGTVVVDGAPLDEPYVRQRRAWDVEEVRLAGDEYLVIGDNRGMPVRNHDFGKARRERVRGRVVRW
ncbi:MAG: signal peptidase I [Vicinamibacterales bacterium]